MLGDERQLFIAIAVFFHQVPLAAAKGWTLVWFAASFSAFAVAHLLSLPFSGPLIDRFGAHLQLCRRLSRR